MKKIFKLFLCLLMLVSFTNITRVFADEEGEYVTAKDVADNFKKTDFIRALIKMTGGDESSLDDLDIQFDETNHKINMKFSGETFMTLNYTDEYISYTDTVPANVEEAAARMSSLGEMIGGVIYLENWMYALLDTMGYSDKDIEIDDSIESTEEFYNQYGVLATDEDYEYDGDEEGEFYSGSVITEFRLSLDKTKIGALLNTYGVERPNYKAVVDGKVVTPTLTLQKKKATLVVKWDDGEGDFVNAVTAKKYEVYRSEKKDGKYTKIATIKRDTKKDTIANSYTDKNVTYGKTYYYKVTAIGKNKATSAVKKFKFVPAKVKNVKTSAIKTDSVKVSWDKQPETGYVIERSTNNKKWTAIKTITKKDTLSFKDKKLKANTKYYYRVKAYKTVGRKVVYGAVSDPVNVVTAPAKPTVKVAANTYESLKLTITTVKGATRYEIYRSNKKDGTYTKVGETTGTTYTDRGLKIDKKYYYKIRGCNKNNKCGTYSGIVNAKVIIKTPKITLETGAKVPMTIKTSGLGSVDGYEIHRSTDKKKWKKIKTLNYDVNTYEDLDVKKGTTYYYKVRTYKYINEEKKYSSYSDVKSLTNKYAAPNVKVKEALSIEEFRNVYKKGNYIIKIHPEAGEVVKVFVSGPSLGDSFYAIYENGKLTEELEEEGTPRIIEELTNNGIKISGAADPNLNGQYERLKQYIDDEYYVDMHYPTDYLNTEYNGIFENENGEYIYMTQLEEGRVSVYGIINGGDIDMDLEIQGNSATRTEMGRTYEVAANSESLTFTISVEGDPNPYVAALNKTKDISKGEIIEYFISRRK